MIVETVESHATFYKHTGLQYKTLNNDAHVAQIYM